MSDRRAEDCPIKFGPMWLRNFTREGSAGASGNPTSASGASGSSTAQHTQAQTHSSRSQPTPALAQNRSQQQQPVKHRLAQYRYGREEMLALYEDNLDIPPGMNNLDALFIPQSQRPIALATDSMDDEPRENIRNAQGLNRNLSSTGGAGLQQMERYGVGRGMGDSTRGRARLHQPFNMASNGRGTTVHRDEQYTEPPAPGLTRSWSSGPHPSPRTGDNPDWNSNRPYFKSQQAKWTEPNWRRPNSAARAFGDDNNVEGTRRLQPLGRPRQPLDKREVKGERPTSWTSNRRPWTGEAQFSDENLPEWATDGNTEASGGTFDSSGAFHGVDSPSVRSEFTQFALSRSHTHGSITTRSRSHEEETPSTPEAPQPTWWNHNKSTGAIPKKFDATKIKFKAPARSKEDGPGTQKSDKPESELEADSTALSSQQPFDQAQEERKKKKSVTFIDEKQVSKTFDALMRMNIKAEEASDERGNFNSVLITPNNALRQKHQNVMPPQNTMLPQNTMHSQSIIQAQSVMQAQNPMQPQNTMQAHSAIQPQNTMQAHNAIQPQNTMQAHNAIQPQNTMQAHNAIQPQNTMQAHNAIQPQNTMQAHNAIQPQNTMQAHNALQSQSSVQAQNSMQSQSVMQAKHTMHSHSSSALQSPMQGPMQSQMQAQNTMQSHNVMQSHNLMQSQKSMQAQSAMQNSMPPQNVMQSQSAMHSQNLMQSQSAMHSQKAMQSQSAMHSQNLMQSQSGMHPQNLMQSQSAMLSQNPVQAQNSMYSQNKVQPQSSMHSQTVMQSQKPLQSQNAMQAQNSVQAPNPMHMMPPPPLEQAQPKTQESNPELDQMGESKNSEDARLFREIFGPYAMTTSGNESTTSGSSAFPDQSSLTQTEPLQSVQKSVMLKNAALKIVKESNTWYYEDPHKNLQGPFTTSEMYTWYRAGFFKSDLLIRRACDKHLRPLGSYGDLPPFAESYSEILSFLTQEALLDNSNVPDAMQHDVMPTRQMSNILQQPASLQTSLQPTQMHAAPLQQLQQGQMHQSALPHLHPVPMQAPMHRPVGATRNYPMDMMMNAPDLAAQPGSILMQQASDTGYRLVDSILQTNLPSGQPAMMPFGSRTSNTFIAPSASEVQDSLWDPASQNFPWVHSTQPNSSLFNPEARWDNDEVPVIPPELPMPEPKNAQSEVSEKGLENSRADLGSELPVEMRPAPPLMDLSGGLPSSLVLGNLRNPPPTTQQAQKLMGLPKDPAIIAAAEDIRQVSPPLQAVAKLLSEAPASQKANGPMTQKVQMTAAKVAESVAHQPAILSSSEETKEQAIKRVTEMEENAEAATPTSVVQSAAEKTSRVVPPANGGQANEKGKSKDNNGKAKKTSKAKEENGDKKKTKEIKVDEPGFIKVEKKEKKKDSERKVQEIKEIPAATKASQRACLEKKRVEEPKVTEESEKKRKDDWKPQTVVDSLSKDDDDFLNKLEILTKSRGQGASKKAPWCPSNPASPVANSDGLTLGEIQRMEREKKFESIKEQQHMFQLIAQQQQAALAREQEINQSGYNWTKSPKAYKPKGSGSMDSVQSLAEIQIQEEIRRRQQLEEQAAAATASAAAAASAAPPPPVTHVPWSGSANSNGGSATSMQSYLGGFWEMAPGAKPEEKTQAPKSQSETQPSKPSKKTKVNTSPSKEPPTKEKPTPATEFNGWCINVLSPWASKIDVPVFVSFLKDIESPYEVKDYVKCYLGEAKESSDFARSFLEKRSKLLRSAMAVPVDDLCSPAPAKNPTSISNSDYLEAKGKPKKVKKNKMLKIDARILGFSVTAAEDRINVGDIDSV